MAGAHRVCARRGGHYCRPDRGVLAQNMNLRERILEHIVPGGIRAERLAQLLGNENASAVQVAIASMLRDGTLVQVVPGYYERPQRALKRRVVKPQAPRPKRVPAICPICDAHIRAAHKGDFCTDCTREIARLKASPVVQRAKAVPLGSARMAP